MPSTTVNPHYAARLRRRERSSALSDRDVIIARTVTIGSATLHLADCFDVLPTLERTERTATGS